MSKFNSFTKLILIVLIILCIISATAFGTIKIMNYRESVLLNNEITAKIGIENFEALDHIETKIVKTVKYYSKDGSMIIEDTEVSEGITNYH